MKFNEDTLSEKPAIEQLKRMGYEFVPGDKLDPQENEDCERTSRREVVLVGRLRRKLAELNPEATEATLDKAIRRVTNIQGTGLLDENKTFHKDLVSNITIEQETGAGRRGLTVKFIDFDKPENNDFLVVNQFSVKGPKGHDRPDIVLFVNGIPLVVIECKSPVARDTGVPDALDQLIRYQREISSLFRTNQILLGVNLFGAKYGVIGADLEGFHEWKAPPSPQGLRRAGQSDERLPNLTDHPSVKEMLALKLIQKADLPRTPAAQDVLIAALLNPRNLLDIIRNFIVFDVDERKSKKKICRYQQFTAVQKIVRRVLEEKEKKGIIWHWQGSGKSLTMLFAALKLRREEKRLKNPYFLVVTDRKDLDKQISDTFRDCGFPNPVRAESGADLYAMLSEGVGRTIMTTVQKFRAPLVKQLSGAENVIVLTDEAHRTQYGNFALNLRKALPNAAFFAFTGTPLDKRDRNTYRHFSPPGERYLDKYDIHQSQEDKATVPIKYMSRLASLHVVGASLDSLLAALFPERNRKELAEIKKQYATPDVLASAPKRIERIAMDIVEHYHQAIKPNGFKAMVVTETREAADMYKTALDKLIDSDLSEVVMTVNKGEEWAEKYRLSDDDESRIKERFNHPKDSLCFLIVCDKLLTGFDAPILQAMYLDKRLKEHTLLQAVARSNRNYPRKNYGLIVDYMGVGTELAMALKAFSKEDLDGLFRTDDVERELKELAGHHKSAMKFFAGLPREGEPRTVIQNCLEVLREDSVRTEFDAAYRAFAKSMDFLMPDVRVDPYLKDFKFLGAVREGARNLYRDERLRMEDLSGKVEALIHAHISAEGIERMLEPLTITAPDFSEQIAAKGSDRAKAAHLEYAIRDTIVARVAENPPFYGSLRKQLEELIESQKRDRKEDADLFRSLMKIKEAESHQDEAARNLGLDGATEFAFFGLIDERADRIPTKTREERADLAKRIIAILEERAVTEWTEREDIQREMRREIKRLLRSIGCNEDDLPAIVREFIGLAHQRMGR